MIDPNDNLAAAAAGVSRRVLACVNACAGIPTDKLEDGILVRLVAACVHIDDPEIRALLEELSPPRPRLVKHPLP